MSPRLDHLFDRLLADPNYLAALAVAARRGSTDHVDDDTAAAMLDGACAADGWVHVLRCRSCRDRVADLAAVLAIHDLVAEPSSAAGWMGTPVVLFASITALPDGDALVETTGAARVHGALAVRAHRKLAAVSFRDRRGDASIEVSVLPGGRSTEISLLVRWLAERQPRMAVRVSSGGRPRAHMAMNDGSSMFTGLRRESARVDVLQDDRRLATAWIGITS
jgi:hypothetical protein